MRLVNITTTARPDGIRISGDVERGSTRFVVYFDYQVDDAQSVQACADAFAAALLLPCMRAGEDLDIASFPISPLLAFNLARIRDIFHAWWPELSRIRILASPDPARASNPRDRAATFFSGGVDSFYSLLKHRQRQGTLPWPLTDIVYMRGVETRLEKSDGVDETIAWIGRIAAATGVGAIIGETNIRTSLQGSEENLHWERHYHGSALAATGLGLSSHLAYICIPSAFSYNHLVAHGSTPLVDEMYSTERLHILHDGAEISRAQKVAKIVEWDRELILDNLRVCIRNHGGAFNCGKCYKCVRTGIALRALGVWKVARTFPDKSTDHWERTVTRDHLALTEENLQFARERGADTGLISMLRSVVQRQRRKDAATTFFNNSPLHGLLPMARHLKALLSRN